MRFKAKPTEALTKEMVDEDLWFFMKEYVDDEGYIYGWYVDGYIVGGMIEANDEYCSLEYWAPVIKDTVVLVEE